MPLVKGGHVVDDSYVRVLDDAPLPDDVPVLLTAQRFLADANELLQREAPIGVIWPNDRKVAELAEALVPFGPPRSDVSLERILHVLGLPPGSMRVSVSVATSASKIASSKPRFDLNW